jgi:uncharacterized membrane protein YtjA (UPF0391 family)
MHAIERERYMIIKWAFISLVAAVAAGLFGLTGFTAAMGIANILFYFFATIFLLLILNMFVFRF